MPAKSFSSGDKIEVICQDEGFKGSLYLAQILEPVTILNSYSVEYETLVDDSNSKLIETVEASHLRPRPPIRDISQFQIGEKVDAFSNDGWWIGEVVKVIEEDGGKRRYVVRFCNEEKDEEIEFGADEIRVHLDWIDNHWISAQDSKTKSKLKFKIGDHVEVSIDDEGFRGAWFSGTITGFSNNDFIVKYHALKTEDDTDFLTETIDMLHIRPCPPKSGTVIFKLLEEVDAYHNDAWWVGVISKVFDGSKYMVYFKSWKEETEYGLGDLRLHHEWIDGEWRRASQALDL